MMQMFFTTHFKGVYVLFKGWKITSTGGLVGSVVIVLVLSILFEILKAYVSSYYNKPEPISSKEDQPLMGEVSYNTIQPSLPRFDLKKNLIKTFFYTLNLFYGYVLMLVAMTFNVWLFLALVIGFGVGYWFSQPFFEPLPLAERINRARSYGTLRSNIIM